MRAHPQGGSWDKLTGGGGGPTKQGGWPREEDPENCPFTKDLNFPKARLSELAHEPFRMYFSFQQTFYFTLYLLPPCLLSFLTRQARLGNVALIAGFCGTVVRTPCLGNKGPVISYRLLLLAASYRLVLRRSEIKKHLKQANSQTWNLQIMVSTVCRFVLWWKTAIFRTVSWVVQILQGFTFFTASGLFYISKL